MDAATALEHLVKACLARRSPALLTELKSEGNFPSLLRLLGIAQGYTQKPLRTVGLRDALLRAKLFVKSSASDSDLATLVDMRDGTVHAAAEEEVHERLLVAFVQHADALLVDLERDRGTFWRDQITVVDALLAGASDKTTHRVRVKLAGAAASFRQRYRAPGFGEVLQVIRKFQETQRLDPGQKIMACPACESFGVVTSDYEVSWQAENEFGSVSSVIGNEIFQARNFACNVCGLRLDSVAELEAAGIGDSGRRTIGPIDFSPRLNEDLYREWLDDHADPEQ